MSKNSVTLIIIILTGSLLTISCGKKNHEKTGILSVGTLKGPSAMSMIKMIDKPVLPGSDDSISFTVFDEPMQLRGLILQEKIDLAMVPTNMAALLISKGVPYKIAAIPVWGTLYLFGYDSIQSWKDLKDKRIHLMARGMTPDILFRYLLTKNNIDPEKDVMLDYSFPTHIDLAQAIMAGKANLGVISEPYVSIVQQRNANIQLLLDLNKEWEKVTGNNIAMAQTTLLVSSKTIANSPDKLESFFEYYKSADKWLKENPDSASSLIVKYHIVPDTIIAKKALLNSNLKFYMAKDVKQSIMAYLEVFFNFDPKTTGNRFPDETYFFP